MALASCSNLVYAIFAVYLAFVVSNLVTLWFPPTCSSTDIDDVTCLTPNIPPTSEMDIYVWASTKARPTVDEASLAAADLRQLGVALTSTLTRELNLTLSDKVRRSKATLYLHALATVHGANVTQLIASKSNVHQILFTSAPLTSRRVRSDINKSILVDSNTSSTVETADSTGMDGRPVNHIRRRARINYVNEGKGYSMTRLPAHLKIQSRQYQPPFYIDTFSQTAADWMLLSSNTSKGPVEVTLELRPISMGMHRFVSTMEHGMETLRSDFGFTEKDTDDVKALFANSSIELLALTYAVTLLHLLFDYLAFKNDIGFWRGRKDLAGLSRRTVIFNFISTLIIFLYLLDSDQTSLIVLGSMGVSLVIEFWKVTKVLRTQIVWSGVLPSIKVVEVQSEAEQSTEQFDATAMVYLSWVLLPLVLGGAVYSLLYTPHRSWYSWVISSLANGVYAFGFILMTPQLFINYRLKSVAHMPWRVLMYKAFNTFIDDVFSFIVHMPTVHRLACLRDDLVFFVYLYQRWLYPVDKTRVNEYGYAYDGESEASEGVDKENSDIAEDKKRK